MPQTCEGIVKRSRTCDEFSAYTDNAGLHHLRTLKKRGKIVATPVMTTRAIYSEGSLTAKPRKDEQ
jgi:hypothetical protein